MMWLLLSSLVSVAALAALARADSAQLQVPLEASTALPFRHFWRSCGWCPPDPHPEFAAYFLTEEQRQNHELIASVPHQGILYYLLDLISLSNATTNSSTITVFGGTSFLLGKAVNWTNLDLSLDLVISSGLLPTFEVMGNPGGALFNSFKSTDQIFSWRLLMRTLAERYIGIYGVENVRRWRFESWNEPDGECKGNLTVGIDCDLPSFLNYYDATSVGLREADPELIFGGPASDGDKMFLYALINHCLHGTNFITNEPGCGRVDYFNAHLKGNSNAAGIIDGELPVVTEVLKLLGNVTIPWGNDEADPLVGWDKQEPWRADARYPGMVVKAINQHLEVFINSKMVTYDLLGNDNGFLPYPDNVRTFTQRTLNARWAMNLTGTVETARKSVLNVMALLSKLATVWYPVVGTQPAMVGQLGAIVTTDSMQAAQHAAIILYNSADSADQNGSTTVSLALASGAGSPLRPLILGTNTSRMAIFALDNIKGNCYPTWVAQGSPIYPTADQFAQIRRDMEIPLVALEPAAAQLTVEVSLPGIVLVHMCADPGQPPAAVTNVRLHATPTRAPPTVLVRWDDAVNLCIQTYQVLYSASGQPPFARVNQPGTIFNSYIHANNATGFPATGCYQIVTVDYWNRPSPASAPVCLPARD